MPVAEITLELDLGGPVGTLDLADLVGNHGTFLAELAGLGLEVIHLGVAPVDDRLEVGVLGLQRGIGCLELAEPLGERLHLRLHSLDISLGGGALRLGECSRRGQRQRGGNRSRKHSVSHDNPLANVVTERQGGTRIAVAEFPGQTL